MHPPAKGHAHVPARNARHAARTGIPTVRDIRFGTPEPLVAPNKARSEPAAINTITEDQDGFAALSKQVSTSGAGENSEAMSSSILKEGAASIASSSKRH